jgi:formylglycine-generating enzyme required for sulfatase activity
VIGATMFRAAALVDTTAMRLIRRIPTCLSCCALAAVCAAAGSQTFKDCDACPEMVLVPAGSFVMGSPDSEPGHNGDEAPQHRVTIAKPFAIGKYEVTTAEWNACLAEVCAGGGTTKPDSDRVPVTNISWNEAKAYVAWLSRRTGKEYRLPSEAEWEYAARAGSMSAYHTGSTLRAEQANVAPEQAKSPGMMSGFGMKPSAQQTVPVGRYPPNEFGLHDVHGNVWEWVEDCVNDGYAGAPTDGSAWTTGNCAKRVVRGGSWVDYPVGARSAIRSGLGTGDRGRALGLRVARTLD